MEGKISRRSFIKGGLATAGAAVASSLPMPEAVKASSVEELATLIDIRKCIGCEACVEACKEVNAPKFPKPKKPFPKMYPNRVKVSDWSGKQDVMDRLTPYNWVYIQEATVNVNGKEETFTLPRRCMHCQNPPCADLCPWGGRPVSRKTALHGSIPITVSGVPNVKRSVLGIFPNGRPALGCIWI